MLLRRVAAGESIVVTDRGRPVARLSPILDSGATDLRGSGLVREPIGRMRDAPGPATVREGQLTAAQALAAARDVER